MGFRANVITRQREYGGQTFCNWSDFTMDFVPKMAELGFEISGNDAEDFFEVEKSKLQEFINTLPDNEEQSISTEHTNKELKGELQSAIDEADKESDWVSWEWF